MVPVARWPVYVPANPPPIVCSKLTASSAAHCVDHPGWLYGMFPGADAAAYPTLAALEPHLSPVSAVHMHPNYARMAPFTADIAVANMVLHHTASPAVVLADLAAALKPGGLLLLSDLCAHDQAWAREACGDLWLGFEPEALSRWAADAGLAQGESVYLALRNGFRIQVRVFHRTA